MFEEFQNIDLFPVSAFDVFGNLIVALICGIIIAMVYRFIYKGPSYSITYVNSLVLLTLITSIVILVIGNNLARAFGLVGAMSIIRFRTAVRDVQDIVFIFFALSIGMAAGVGLHVIAISSTITISVIAIVLVTFNFGAPQKQEYLLQVAYGADPSNENNLRSVLKKYCRSYRMVNLKNVGDDQLEAFYHVVYKRKKKGSELLQELQSMKDVSSVNLFFDQDDSDPGF
ncbi:MAG: DUF4956 domain-containing protein [Bacteroidales bacterium]|nr:DUF4956 domain-containing protein [Bacteroidales bacterium]MCF8405028.1 DUF4956 domain-containing protein [Bacteroidales bacterium]